MKKQIDINAAFNDILETDEKIIEVYKPDKKRYWRDPLIFLAIPIFWPHFIILMVLTLFTLPFFYAKGYNNLYYTYTNKRLIVRKGYIGVDYISLEYKDITSTSVSVGILDKSRNTGTLSFSSPSTARGGSIRFAFITNPYETLKEIKEYMNTRKEENSK